MQSLILFFLICLSLLFGYFQCLIFASKAALSHVEIMFIDSLLAELQRLAYFKVAIVHYKMRCLCVFVFELCLCIFFVHIFVCMCLHKDLLLFSIEYLLSSNAQTHRHAHSAIKVSICMYHLVLIGHMSSDLCDWVPCECICMLACMWERREWVHIPEKA